MVGKRFWGGLLGATVILPAGVLAEDRPPLVLKPSSAWNVNYADDGCRLGRIFGEGDRRTILMIDRFEPGDPFQLLIASKLLTRNWNTPGSRKVTLRFGPGEDEQSSLMRQATFQKMPALIGSGEVLGVRPVALVHQAEVAVVKAAGDNQALKPLAALTPASPLTPSREAAVTYLEIAGASRDRIVLETGAMDKPMAVLRTCTDDLLSHWGIDVEAHKSLSRKAAPTDNPGSWVSSDDYPSGLVSDGVQGLIQFRLSIDETGKVSDCRIQQSTRPVEFDTTVCRIMSNRARFEPALDAAGKPIKSYWRSSFAFIIE